MPGWLAMLASEGGPAGPTLFGLELTLVFWTVLTFLLLLLALRFTAWPKIIQALDEREKRIQKRFDDAEARVAAAERRAAEYEERLRHIEDEGRKIIEESRTSATRVAADVEANARSEIERLIERAKKEISLARGKAVDDLKREVIDLSVRIVEKVLEEQVSEEKPRRFVDDCIAKYEKLKL